MEVLKLNDALEMVYYSTELTTKKYNYQREATEYYGANTT